MLVKDTRTGDVGTTQGDPVDGWVGVRFGPGHEIPPAPDDPIWGYERIGSGPQCRSVLGRYGQMVRLEHLETTN